jgi:hypothetical protein
VGHDFDLKCVDWAVELKAEGGLVAAAPGFDLMHVEEVVVVGHLATHFDERWRELVEVVALKVREL